MTVSDTFKAAMYQQQTDEVLLALIVIAHDDLASPIRVCSNVEDITQGGIVYDDEGVVTTDAGTVTDGSGDTYTAFPFEVELPDPEGLAILSICNVDRQIVEAIRTIDSPPTVTLSLVLADSPDVVEAGPFEFELTDVTYDALIVSGTLSFDHFLDEIWPGDRFTPGQFAGLF